jgi:transcriptional regulator with XRE-family HTH domain
MAKNKLVELRKRNLIQLSKDFVSASNLARVIGLKGPSYLSQIMRGHREMSDRTALLIENKLNLQPGWMSSDHRGGSIVDYETRTLDTVLEGVLRAVEDSGKDIPNSKFVEIIKLATRHIRESGRLDNEFLHDVVRLASR